MSIDRYRFSKNGKKCIFFLFLITYPTHYRSLQCDAFLIMFRHAYTQTKAFFTHITCLNFFRSSNSTGEGLHPRTKNQSKIFKQKVYMVCVPRCGQLSDTENGMVLIDCDAVVTVFPWFPCALLVLPPNTIP